MFFALGWLISSYWFTLASWLSRLLCKGKFEWYCFLHNWIDDSTMRYEEILWFWCCFVEIVKLRCILLQSIKVKIIKISHKIFYKWVIHFLLLVCTTTRKDHTSLVTKLQMGEIVYVCNIFLDMIYNDTKIDTFLKYSRPYLLALFSKIVEDHPPMIIISFNKYCFQIILVC